ncbi:MAG TPA: glycoside hydrolase domain-containing protein [Ornithinimicrobium sp.]|nr:glycoside hydrolase domain-containing protein [Ornithinimicrobium sp.]
MSRPVARPLAAILGLLAGLLGILGTPAPAAADNVVTPGSFTGYGFDQCLAPTQKAMNAWLKHSPFLSVGIYISGDSRACRSQPNLTTDWISTQLRKGWRLLPITLGPQASCSTRFPRYGDDETIIPRPGKAGKYRPARRQGRAEAVSAVAAAKKLGIVPGSTLWYDLEGFDHTNRHCRESALSFLSAWTTKLHELDYVSGVYSSVGSGIKALDDARVERPQAYVMPDAIWLARWDGVANTSSSYIREDGWRPGGRVKQYRGGHDETWGGVRINIDSNYLDLGKGSWAAPETHCDGVPVDLTNYKPVKPATTATDRVRALQCLLTEKGVYDGKLSGAYSPNTIEAVHAWQDQRGLPTSDVFTRTAWMTLVAAGPRAIVKFGSAGPEVRRVQRALNAASKGAQLEVTGVFTGPTDKALRAYQARVGITVSGVAAPNTWTALRTGTR